MRIRTMVVAILALLATGAVSQAGVIYTVSMDTTALVGGGAFWLTFLLGDGSGTGDGNNAVVLSNFDFGGGTALSPPSVSGPASGSLTDGVNLTDSDPLLPAYFAQQFTAGAALRFVLEMTTEVDAGGVYDQFIFAIADSSFTNLPTTSTLAPDVFLSVIVDASTPTIERSGTDPDRTGLVVNAPALDNEVPEPAMWLPAGLLLGGAWCLRRRQARRG